MDVMVLSTWREGFPNVVLEAEATAIPVVTTESSGSRDSIVREVTGLLIPPGYPEDNSEAVLKLLRDPGLRLHMGAAGRMWVTLNVSETRVLHLAVSFYCSLMATGLRLHMGTARRLGETLPTVPMS